MTAAVHRHVIIIHGYSEMYKFELTYSKLAGILQQNIVIFIHILNVVLTLSQKLSMNKFAYSADLYTLVTTLRALSSFRLFSFGAELVSAQ